MKSTVVHAQRSGCEINQPSTAKHCSSDWNGLPDVQRNQHESHVRRSPGSRAKTNNSRNFITKILGSGGKTKSHRNQTSDVVNECSQTSTSHKLASATVDSTNHCLRKKTGKQVRRKCQAMGSKQKEKAKATKDQKLVDLQPRTDDGNQSFIRKSGKQRSDCGKQTKKMQATVMCPQQSTVATAENQQLEDLPGSTALQPVDNSLAGKSNSVVKKAIKHRTVDCHVTEKPRKKDNRTRFRDVCLICTSAFASRSLLSDHLVSVHSDDDKSLWPYPCRFCEERLLTFAQLRRHEREIHPEGYRAQLCQTCGKGFVDENGLRWHQINMHKLSEKRFVCDICGKQFCHASKMEAHRRRHKNDRRYPCPFCEKRFHANCHLDVHILQHLGVQPHACMICHRTFYQKSHLHSHLRYHHPKIQPQKVAMKCHSTEHSSISDTSTTDLDSDMVETMHGSDSVEYHCNQCDAWFTNSAELKKHQTLAHPIKILALFACTACGRRFPSYTALNKHRKESSHGTEMVYVCDICNDQFPTAFRLRVHRFRHLSERPFICRRCGRRFRSQRQINLHVLRHSDVLKYKCQKCNSVYYSSHLLSVHMLRHFVSDPFELTNHRDRMSARKTLGKFVVPSSKKPRQEYICRECGCQFGHLQALRVHLQNKHLLQYLCTECGKYFSSLGNLRRHQLIHSGTRKYSCDECGRQFTQSNTLKDHVRIHTGVRPFVCAVCGHGYTQSSHLKNHMRTHI